MTNSEQKVHDLALEAAKLKVQSQISAGSIDLKYDRSIVNSLLTEYLAASAILKGAFEK